MQSTASPPSVDTSPEGEVAAAQQLPSTEEEAAAGDTTTASAIISPHNSELVHEMENNNSNNNSHNGNANRQRSTPTAAGFSRSLLWRIEENLLLKQAVRKLQDEESDQQRRSERTEDGPAAVTTTTATSTTQEETCCCANDWEMTLFSPLGPDHAVSHFGVVDGVEHHVVSFAPEHSEIVPQHDDDDDDGQQQQHAQPDDSVLFASNNSAAKAGDLTVATEAESHLLSTDAESHLVSDFETDEPEFEPVQIEWEDPRHLLTCPRILTPSMMQHLHDHAIPETLQGNRWERCFAIGRDGDSFVSFLDRCAPYRHTLLVIQTTEGYILGGFAGRTWQVQEGYGKRHAYYGTGQSFLFCTHPGSYSESLLSGSTVGELQIFKWTGVNDYCQICDSEEAKVAMGGGGNFGLIVEDGFFRGQTGFCGTYGNPPLVPGGFFEVASLEVYGLMPLFQSFHSLSSSSNSQSESTRLAQLSPSERY